MSIRRKRRQRGKRKEARKQELKAQAATWRKLANVEADKSIYGKDFASVLLPLIRNLTPTLIAQDIVGIQPMNIPGTDHEYNSKQAKKERKAQRRAAKQEKRARHIMEKIMQDLKTQA